MEQLLELDRFADISAQKLVDAIAAVKTPPLERFVYGLGIRHVGVQTAIDLVNHFGSMDALQHATIDQLEAVAREAETYAASYPEGSGPGLRYTAFERYGKIAVQSIARLRQADHALGELRDGLKPLDSTESQLRAFRQVFDAIPWSDVRETLHSQKLETPTVPAYSDFVDRSVAGQEDLLIALTELFTAPTARHVFAFALAAFIDVLVFLLAYAAGPFFFGASEDRWLAAGAALDSVDDQVFLRNLVRKLVPSPQGLARVEGATLSPGELQLFLLLTAKGLAARSEEEGKLFYLLDQSLHQRMVESLAVRGLSLHANPQPARS